MWKQWGKWPIADSLAKSKPIWGKKRGANVPIDRMDARPSNVLLLVTGSVAAIKTVELASAFIERGHCVKVVASEKALFFINTSTTETDMDEAAAAAAAKRRSIEIVGDADEWSSWSKRGDPVVHIDLRKWADIAVVAPLDANTLGKLSCGICDNLLTSVMRAWPCGMKPVVVAPAMNEAMWHHPLTAPQLRVLESVYGRGVPGNSEHPQGVGNGMFRVVDPVEKVLMCGEVGIGAMAPLGDIVAAAEALLLCRPC